MFFFVSAKLQQPFETKPRSRSVACSDMSKQTDALFFERALEAWGHCTQTEFKISEHSKEGVTKVHPRPEQVISSRVRQDKW